MEFNSFNRRNRHSSFRYFISGLAGAFVGLLLFFLIVPQILFSGYSPRLTSPPIQQETQPSPQVGSLGTTVNSNVTGAAQKVIPSVVGITISKIEGGKLLQGVGSGVIIDSAGYILTNNHVAGGSLRSMVISLYDGRNVNGTTIWADPTLDLAVVRINANGLTAASLGDSKAAAVGQQAIAIGNPLGLTLQRTVTAGIISAVNRTIEVESGAFMEGLLQTDASINPGNSGGPLINVKGEVMGINTMKVTTAEGLGFAVPINVAKPVINRIKSTGVFSTPTLALQALDRDVSRVYKFTLSRGVYVYNCIDGGSAHKAGIRKGDVILSIDGKAIDTAAEFKETLYKSGVGKTVKLRVKNGKGVEKDIHVKLDGIK